MTPLLTWMWFGTGILIGGALGYALGDWFGRRAMKRKYIYYEFKVGDKN